MTPTDHSLLAPLDAAIHHSEDLIRLAREDDWAAFEARLADRQHALSVIGENQYLIDVAREGLAESVRERIATLQQLNDELESLAVESKSRISAQLKTFATGDKAVKAYKE